MSARYKIYSLLFLLIFIAAHISFIHHNMEHGVLEHSHAGEQCQEYVFVKFCNADAKGASIADVTFTEYKAVYAIAPQSLIISDLAQDNFARAPPFFS